MQLTAAVINAGLGDLTLGLQMSGFQVVAAFEDEEKAHGFISVIWMSPSIRFFQNEST